MSKVLRGILSMKNQVNYRFYQTLTDLQVNFRICNSITI
nr:MAG TPA: hypothetical protein [Crassvirales sp.]